MPSWQRRHLIVPSPGLFLAEGWAQLGVHKGGAKGWADRKVTGRGGGNTVVPGPECRCSVVVVVVVTMVAGAASSSSSVVLLMPSRRYGGVVVIVIVMAAVMALSCQAQGAIAALQHRRRHRGSGGGLPMPSRWRRRCRVVVVGGTKAQWDLCGSPKSCAGRGSEIFRGYIDGCLY